MREALRYSEISVLPLQSEHTCPLLFYSMKHTHINSALQAYRLALMRSCSTLPRGKLNLQLSRFVSLSGSRMLSMLLSKRNWAIFRAQWSRASTFLWLRLQTPKKRRHLLSEQASIAWPYRLATYTFSPMALLISI